MTELLYNSWRLEWAVRIRDTVSIEWAFVNYAQDILARSYIIEQRNGMPFRSNLYRTSIDAWHCTPGLAPKDVIRTRIYDYDDR